jgi:hypothetical protein
MYPKDERLKPLVELDYEKATVIERFIKDNLLYIEKNGERAEMPYLNMDFLDTASFAKINDVYYYLAIKNAYNIKEELKGEDLESEHYIGILNRKQRLFVSKIVDENWNVFDLLESGGRG